MPSFIVKVPEVHYQSVCIEAETRDEALNKVEAGEGDLIVNELEYLETLERNEYEWLVREVEVINQ